MPAAGQDAIHFELTDFPLSIRLSRHLAPKWQVSLEARDGISVVTPLLRDHPDDLALVLRSVERWIEEESILALICEIDGRKYVLQAGEADWSKAPGLRIAPSG
jgi:hypothetical protein